MFVGVYVEGSVLTIVCMSAERYLAIRHPIKARVFCNASKVKQAVVVTWMTSIIAMCPLVMYKRLKDLPSELDITSIQYCIETWPSKQDQMIYNIFLLFIIYIIPGLVVMVLYSLIGFSLCRKDDRLQRSNSIVNGQYDDIVMVNRRRLARLLIILSVLFALSWMPYFLLSLFLYLDLSVESQQIMNQIYPFALLLGHSNCAQNPILYSFMHKGFHKFTSQIFRCRCDKVNEGRLVSNICKISAISNSFYISPPQSHCKLKTKWEFRNFYKCIQHSDINVPAYSCHLKCDLNPLPLFKYIAKRF